jgi:thioesterase domain-containing protein
MLELAKLDQLLAAMPPVAAMAIRSESFDGEELRLHAPLSANVNDKECAFGGSLASVMTLAGWGWLMLHSGRAGFPADVYVADSQIRYLAPLFGDLRAIARLAEGEDWPAAVRTLAQRGRARVAMQAQVTAADGTPVATLAARFVLKRA